MSSYHHQRPTRFANPLSMKVRYLSYTLLAIGLTACQPATETASHAPESVQSKSEVIVAQTPASIPPATVGLKRMDFPVYLAGVPSLLHPIIPSVPLNAKSDSYSDVSKRTAEGYFQEVSPYEFQSSVYNIVFEDLKSGEIHRLFPQDNFIIKAIHTPLVPINPDDKTVKQKASVTPQATTTEAVKDETQSNEVRLTNSSLMGYFIYEVKEIADDDDSKTNLDQQLTLYMSDVTGKNLFKLTPNSQYFKNYKWIAETKRFYFSTQSDSNGDRVIDENDKYFYYFIDFAKNPELVTAYDFTKTKS